MEYKFSLGKIRAKHLIFEILKFWENISNENIGNFLKQLFQLNKSSRKFILDIKDIIKIALNQKYEFCLNKVVNCFVTPNQSTLSFLVNDYEKDIQFIYIF